MRSAAAEPGKRTAALAVAGFLAAALPLVVGRRGTYEQLPDGAVVEARSGLRIKGKDEVLDAYVLLALP